MDALLLIASKRRGLVGGQVIDQRGAQLAECIADADVALEGDRPRLARRGPRTIAQMEAALGLAFIQESERRHLQKVEAESDQGFFGAALQFELEFADGFAM